MKSIYLVAYYFQRPANQRVRTNRAGWQRNQANVSWDEQVALTKNLKNRDLTTAKVILDLANQRVVKNDWRVGQEFSELYNYFEQSYPEYTTKIMEQLRPQYTVSVPAGAPITTINTSSTISSV